MKKVKKLHILLWGTLIGTINGLLGGGGGMVVVPLLNKFFGLEQKKAQATAIFVILPISIASSIVYLKHSTINFGLEWGVLLGVVIGGVVGSVLLSKLSNVKIKFIFTALMIVAGVSMLIF